MKTLCVRLPSAIVLDSDAYYTVQNIINGTQSDPATSGSSSDDLMQATILYKVGGVGGTYTIEGNSSDLVREIEIAIKDIEENRQRHGGIG